MADKIVDKAIQLRGLNDAVSGTMGNVVVQKNGRIRIKRDKIKRKIVYPT